jgi:hypothetical protein
MPGPAARPLCEFSGSRCFHPLFEGRQALFNVQVFPELHGLLKQRPRCPQLHGVTVGLEQLTGDFGRASQLAHGRTE